jgi:hypothetical protein
LANESLSWQVQESSIILITDGRANMGINPLIAAQESRDMGIPLYIMDVWWEGSPLYYTDPYNKKRIEIPEDSPGSSTGTIVDDTLLQEMSKITWWAYFRVTDIKELYGYWDMITTKIGNLDKKVTEPRYISYRPYLCIALIVLLCIERGVTRRIFYKNRAQ